LGEIDKIIDDLRKTHLIVNSEAGHGKTTFVKNVIRELKVAEPKTIVKIFDISQAWSETAPVPHRQRITPQTLIDFTHGKTTFLNIGDCVYEMGSLTEEMRRFFTAIIIKQDYESRYEMAERYGVTAVSKLPRIIFVFEEADCYFDSSSLNKKDMASEKLRDFVKVGRNFGLRGICIVTACVGELATKLRRRSKHLIGKIISDSDYKEYNRMKKWKKDKRAFGLGDLARENPEYFWLYYNGEYLSEPFKIEDLVKNKPQDYEVTKSYPWDDLPRGEVARAETRRSAQDEPKDDYALVKWILFLAVLAFAWFYLT